jgi:hypothetical protein
MKDTLASFTYLTLPELPIKQSQKSPRVKTLFLSLFNLNNYFKSFDSIS